MREIKFRGHDEHHWRYGFLSSISRRRALINQPDREIFAVLPDSVGQYTGFSDTHGAEIFEGDIISFLDWQDNEYRDLVLVINRARVCFGRSSGAWEIADETVPRGALDNKLATILKSESVKVIGNTFENAELLKGEK